MGVAFVTGTVSGPSGTEVTLEFLVDSGATYTLLPESAWRRLGIEPRRRQRFRLADGTAMEREIGECRIRLDLGETATPVILGTGEDEMALLGAVTLEEMGLVLNPLTRQLYPASLLQV